MTCSLARRSRLAALEVESRRPGERNPGAEPRMIPAGTARAPVCGLALLRHHYDFGAPFAHYLRAHSSRSITPERSYTVAATDASSTRGPVLRGTCSPPSRHEVRMTRRSLSHTLCLMLFTAVP